MVRLVKTFGYKTIEFESASAFLALAAYEYPACILLDVRLPDINGLELQTILKQKEDRFPIIFMSGHGDIPMSVKAMKKGAVDFLSKPFEPDFLREAIDQAIVRNTHETEKRKEKEEIQTLIETLTPREKEVMQWVITGMLNKQIAYELGTSEKTIKVHRSRVMKKTRASSVAALVRLTEKVNIKPKSNSVDADIYA